MYWTDVWKKLWPVALVRSSPVDECSSGIFNTCLKMFEEESRRRSLTCSSCSLHIMLLSYFLSLVHTLRNYFTSDLEGKLPLSLPCSPLMWESMKGNSPHVLPRVLLFGKRGLPYSERYGESGNQIRAIAEAASNLWFCFVAFHLECGNSFHVNLYWCNE